MKKRMKKILALLLTTAAVSNSFGSLAQTNASAAETIMYGDADHDTKISASDALCVLKSVVGLIKPEDELKTIMDVDADGNITAGDALCILKYVVGLIDHFDAETIEPGVQDNQTVCPDCGAPARVIWDSSTSTETYHNHYICNGCHTDFGWNNNAAGVHIVFADFYGPCQNYSYAPVAFFNGSAYWDYEDVLAHWDEPNPYQRQYQAHRHYECTSSSCGLVW